MKFSSSYIWHVGVTNFFPLEIDADSLSKEKSNAGKSDPAAEFKQKNERSNTNKAEKATVKTTVSDDFGRAYGFPLGGIFSVCHIFL